METPLPARPDTIRPLGHLSAYSPRGPNHQMDHTFTYGPTSSVDEPVLWLNTYLPDEPHPDVELKPLSQGTCTST